MPKFRKKPVVIEAAQWFKNGDHPQDYPVLMDAAEAREHGGEGDVVRYYRNAEDSGDRECEHCGKIMHKHGWIDTLEGGHIVCPGDWIITGVKGELYPCKPDIFEETYEPAGSRREEAFVRHVAGHLHGGQEVICKICGRTAKDICAEDRG